MNKENSKSGFLLLDKPAGPTSFGMIPKLRRITGIKKIGHAGTLDPFATGLLIIAISREATREIDKYVKLAKVYEAELCLGKSSTTFDPEGDITKTSSKNPSLEEIERALEKFSGKIKQVPPMYSAIKVNGQKLYNLARRGIEIERKPRDVEIFENEVLEYNYPLLKIKTYVSSGTYIRSLASDIGEELETGAYLKNLRRTRIGDMRVEDACKIEELEKGEWERFLKFL